MPPRLPSIQTEDDIHKAVVHRLRVQCRNDVLWWHTPNGGHRHPAVAAKMKALGTLAGVPDLFFYKDKELAGMELKTSKGRLSDSQKEFRDRFTSQGGIYFPAYGLDEALSWLSLSGII